MAIPLRSDFDATALRAAARGTKDAAQGRRLLALAAVYEGSRRTEAAKIGGVTLQIVRDWVLKLGDLGRVCGRPGRWESCRQGSNLFSEKVERPSIGEMSDACLDHIATTRLTYQRALRRSGPFTL